MNRPALRHRPALADDLGELVGFPRDADELFYCHPKTSWPLTVDQLAAAMAGRHDSTVVLLDGRLAGFANFHQWQPNEFCAPGNMMVTPWARRHGVAQYLIEVMENLARDQYKAQVMKVSCFNANAAGLLLGYKPQGIIERADPQGRRVALVQLEKALVHA